MVIAILCNIYNYVICCVSYNYAIFANIFVYLQKSHYIAAKRKHNYMIEKDKRDGIATNIENVVSDFFNLHKDDVFSKNLKREFVIARHMTIFMLHDVYKFSIRYLANRYDHSVRSTNRVCANMRDYISYDKKTRTQYNCLLRYIKEKGE